MKIAIVFRPDTPVQIPSLGGISNFVYFLSKGLVDKGHDVTVFCSKNSKLAKGVKVVKCPVDEKKVDIYAAGNKFYNSIKDIKRPKDIVDESFGNLSQRFHDKQEFYANAFAQSVQGKFDVIHIANHEMLPHYLGLFSKVPSVISLHGDYDLLSEHEKRMFQQANKMQKAGTCNCKFVSVSKYIQKKYAKYIKSDLIYNSVNFEALKFQKNKKNYIAYLGRIEQNKNIDFAIKFSKKYNIPLIIAGSIADKWYFENKVKPHLCHPICHPERDPCHPELVSGSRSKSTGSRNKFGMTKGKGLIKFIGKVNETQKNKLLGNAKALIMPTKYEEAFGRVVVEAMACGTLVIAFKKGALPELVINNKTGFLIKENDLAGAKKAFDKLDKIKPEVCRKFVEKNFTLERMIREYEKLYKRVGK